jgi:TolB-like protein/DNA-binding SARP family transcriptional activator
MAMNMASAVDGGIGVPARWSLRLLGGFELGMLPGGERVASPGKRERVLLAYLTLSQNCRQPRRKLATLLWGDATDETATDNLRNCLWGLRKALNDTEHRFIVSEGDDIVLDAAAFDVDALAFRRLAAQSGRSELESAANLYSGEFLDGLSIESEEFESWRRAEATRCRDQAIDVLTRLMTQLGECGEIERAIEMGSRILRLEPLHEAAIRRLMRLYGESGRRGAADQLYRKFADALRTELHSQPAAETRLVFAEIARGEGRTSPAAGADATLPALSMTMARPSDAPATPLRLATRPAFRLRAALAILAGVLIVATVLISYALLGTRQAGAISVAVLPFVNLSGDTAQEFFSDGMTEEITAALAKIADLRVVGRTSAFQFKGDKKDLRAIGRTLNATHLLEGSVRKEGDRLRISAQLIQADNGVHVWTENYDRQLTDIFTTQENIAEAIAAALRVPLGLPRGKHLVPDRTSDVEAYQQFLRARAGFRSRLQFAPIIVDLEQLVERDPGFAPAWGLLSNLYINLPAYDTRLESRPVEESRRLVQSAMDKAEKAAREAVRLDPGQVNGLRALATLEIRRKNWAAAEDLLRQALASDPNDTDTLSNYGGMLANVGRRKESLRFKEQVHALEPFIPTYNTQNAVALGENGQAEAAISILEADALPPNANIANIALRNEVLAPLYAAAGRYGKAADAMLAIPKTRYGDSGQQIEDAARLIRGAPVRESAPDALPILPGRLNFVYAYIGAPNRVLDHYERALEAGLPYASRLLSDRLYAPVRQTERFKTLMRNVGLVDYWRARGWPDMCRPQGADDFICN